MMVQQALVTLPHSVYEPDTDQVINMSTLNRPPFSEFSHRFEEVVVSSSFPKLES
jgi:hypothetical protein